jgi:hypothetical protein
MSISIDLHGDTLDVRSPYDNSFVKQARQLGGTWTGDVWRFDARDEERVRELCREVYGVDGREGDQTADIRIDLNEAGFALSSDKDQRLKLLGRQLAHRPSRDQHVRLADNVVVLEGEFSDSGGSRKNPKVGPLGDIILEVRDLPLRVAKRASDEIAGVALVGDVDADDAAKAAFRSAAEAALADGLAKDDLIDVLNSASES